MSPENLSNQITHLIKGQVRIESSRSSTRTPGLILTYLLYGDF